MASSITNDPFKDVVVPSYLQPRLSGNMPGVMGWVLEYKINGLIRLKDAPRDQYTEHSWYASMQLTDKPSRETLQRYLSSAHEKLRDIDFSYKEYDYDEEGNEIPGSAREVHFDKWILLDGNGEIIHTGEIHDAND